MTRRFHEKVRQQLGPLPELPDTLANKLSVELCRALIGVDDAPDPDEVEAARLKQLCIDGNPFPLVAWQWPELLVTDPDDAKWFDGEIGNADNPCLRLDAWQRDIIASAFAVDIREMAVKGNTKAGKGASVSIVANLWFYVFDEAKVVLTSQRYDHAVSVIFGEVSAWRGRMQHPGPGNLLKEGISHTKQHYVAVANPESGEGFSGQHGPRTLFIFDESSALADLYYTNAQKQSRLIIALSNPRTLSGWFKRLYPPSDPDKTQTISTPLGRRRCITVSGADCLNVRASRLETPIAPYGGITVEGETFMPGSPIPEKFLKQVALLIPNQCDLARYRGLCAHPDPREVDIYAHGKFPKEDATKQLILGTWMPRAVAAWRPDIRVEAFGFDVAGSDDGDLSYLAAGGLEGVRATHGHQERDTMGTIGWVLALAQAEYGIDLKLGNAPIVVDMHGLGLSVGQRLRELGCWVIEAAAGPTLDKRRYRGRRAEVYGELARRLDPQGMWPDSPWALPEDYELHDDLCAPEKIYDSSGAFGLTPKNRQGNENYRGDTIHEKLGRSPDKGDAVVYLYQAVWKRAWKQVPRVRRELLGWPYVDLDSLASADEKTDSELPVEPLDRAAIQAAIDAVVGPVSFDDE